ncbi:unnamed protein product [Clonostachys solani]|uniref:DEUBAD domain-containing protein n=1 Tax=Clonostachys solani TaxID=160281 RepID=A0A9N9ZPC5_9HYPO|nr:unnamed protein product [Clonostachys solani]
MEDEHDQQGDTSSSSLSSAPSLVESDILPTDSTQSSQDESRANTTSSGERWRNPTSREDAKPASTVTIKRPTKPTKARKWDAENIVINPKSPLAKADLRRLLANPVAWEILDATDKAEILALFPDKEHILDPDSENARPNLMSLMNDDTFRHDCATYTENIALGRFDPEWLASAWSAHERRKLGDFDEHLADKFEAEWQVQLPQDFKPKRQVNRGSSQNEAVNGENKALEATPRETQDGDGGPGGSEMKDLTTETPTKVARCDAVDSDAMSIDELQADDPQPQEAPTPSSWKQRRGSTIHVSGIADEKDELA